MEFHQSQNLTLGFSQPEVTYWKSTPQLSSSVNNTIVMLGMLIFALQLCLVLFFLLRCWRFDNRVGKALKHPDTNNKLIAPSTFHLEIFKQASYQLFDAAAPSPTLSAAVEEYEPFPNSLFAPSIPWDLVQH